MTKMKPKTKSRIAFSIAGVLIASALAAVFAFLHLYQAANPEPSPNTETAVEAQSEFPEVDWNYWLGINPDIVGWITIPGTDVNHPIVQAPVDDPDYYLHHDVYKNYNPMGCLYLDADCTELGLSTRNAVILGHHWQGVNAVAAGGFAVIADYKDRDFAAEHAKILIQTPTAKMKYQVRFADIVPGWNPTKRCTFEGDADYRQWYEESLESAAMTLDGDTRPNQTISLVSCSYNYWSWNERTVLVTSMEHEDTQNSFEAEENSANITQSDSKAM